MNCLKQAKKGICDFFLKEGESALAGRFLNFQVKTTQSKLIFIRQGVQNYPIIVSLLDAISLRRVECEFSQLLVQNPEKKIY